MVATGILPRAFSSGSSSTTVATPGRMALRMDAGMSCRVAGCLRLVPTSSLYTVAVISNSEPARRLKRPCLPAKPHSSSSINASVPKQYDGVFPHCRPALSVI